ncbi:DUF1440 domain-containing protein [Arthrobacter sp. Br18]|uniref:DUF1440 domain-containing protein n=1 Tax=Arthrobacter sp. Br18 TaxID=1312954 RepID=UPI001C1DDE6D|nr:DUF1440 domain-containing protein [Arthrobacter sp. Br18]
MTHPPTTENLPDGRTNPPGPSRQEPFRQEPPEPSPVLPSPAGAPAPEPAPAHHVTSERSIALDMILGAAAGAAGVWAMDRVGGFLYNHEDPAALEREHQARAGGKDVAHAAIEKAADKTGIDLPTGEPNPAGITMHYALGILPGALHAVIRREAPFMKAGNGALYGFGLYVLNDEIVAPALGLASGPKEYPWQAHARGMVAHTVLGVVTESLLRISDRAR